MKKIMGALLALSLFVGVATVTFAQTDTDKKAGKKKGGKKGGTDAKTDKGGDKSSK
jgi:uncharacterized protein YxeA